MNSLTAKWTSFSLAIGMVIFVTAFGSVSLARQSSSGAFTGQTARSFSEALQRATNTRAYIAVDSPPVPLRESMDVATLYNGSSLVAIGKVIDRVSMAQLSSDSMQTTYSFQLDRVFKGTSVSSITFTLPGGVLILPNKSIINLKTIESMRVRPGNRLILFLNKSGDTYLPTNGIEGIFFLSLPDGGVISLTDFDSGSSHVFKHVQLGTFKSFSAVLQQLSASNASKFARQQ